MHIVGIIIMLPLTLSPPEDVAYTSRFVHGSTYYMTNHITQTIEAVSLSGVYVPWIYHMPDGVVVGDSGLCCCVPAQCVTSVVREQ